MVVNKFKSDEQISADILQCKADILRASDIIPSSKKEVCQEAESENNSGNIPSSADAVETLAEEEKRLGEDTSSIPIETVDSEEAKPAEIPKFDLAEEIMAEQRRVTAIKRRGPSQKAEARKEEPEVESVDYTVGQPVQASLEEEQIIAEIVARDIERLCRGAALGGQEQSFDETNERIRGNGRSQS